MRLSATDLALVRPQGRARHETSNRHPLHLCLGRLNLCPNQRCRLPAYLIRHIRIIEHAKVQYQKPAVPTRSVDRL